MCEAMEKFSTYSSIRKEILLPGRCFNKVTTGSVCKVSVQIHAGNITDCNNLLSPKTMEITVGNGNTTFEKTLDYCITTMTIGEVSIFTDPTTDTASKFQLSLEDCTLKPHLFQLTDNQKMEIAKAYKEEGVEMFKKQQIGPAFYKFKKALQYTLTLNVLYYNTKVKSKPGAYAGEPSISVGEVNEFRMSLYNNLAFCQLKCKNYSLVVPLCTKAINIQPCVKAYYRRALAFIAMGNKECAERDLIDLLKIESNNQAALHELNVLQAKDKDNRENYKNTIKKMFT